MSIKIITKGIDPKTIPLRGTCYTCKTVVECEQADARAVDAYDCMYRLCGTNSTVTCPVCNSTIVVTKHIEIPAPPEPPKTRIVRDDRKPSK